MLKKRQIIITVHSSDVNVVVPAVAETSIATNDLIHANCQRTHHEPHHVAV